MSTKPLSDWPKWRDELIYHLRMKDVSGDRIGDILLEVEEHVRESGETPNDAFGDAKTYAVTRTDVMPASAEEGEARDKHNLLLIMLFAFAGSALYATGSQSIGAGTDALFGLKGWIAFVLGAIILLVGLWRLPFDFVRHPTTDESMFEDNAKTGRLIGAIILIVVGVVFYFLGRIVGG